MTVVKQSRQLGRQGPCLNGTNKRQKFSSCHDFSVKLSYAYVCLCILGVDIIFGKNPVASLRVAPLVVGIRMQYLAISDEDFSTYVHVLVCEKSCFVQ